jgi:hypothetical protein
MRKIISLMHVSLDGFVADLKAPAPGLDWMAYTGARAVCPFLSRAGENIAAVHYERVTN